MSQEPNRHHYIPEFFSKRWCIGEKLTRYVRTPRGIYCKEHAPKAVAFRTDLYKLQGAGIGDPYSIEKHTYQRLDSDAALVFAKLLKANREAPNPDEMLTLSLFLLALPARNPWAHVEGEKIARAAHIAEINSDPKLAAALKLPMGPKLFEAVEIALPHMMADQTRRILVKTWADDAKALRMLQMDWSIRDLDGAATDLVLGDCPLMRHGDFLNGKCVWVLPISPRRLLIATNMPGFAKNLESLSDDEVVRRVNRDSAFLAKEHFFATGRQHVELAEELLGKSPSM